MFTPAAASSKVKFHVVAKVRASLRPVTRAAAAENILEAEEIAENILKFVEDGLIDSALEAAAGKSRVSEAVIGRALLRRPKESRRPRWIREIFPSASCFF